MYVSARTDYAVRAMLSITADHPHLVKAATLAGLSTTTTVTS